MQIRQDVKEEEAVRFGPELFPGIVRVHQNPIVAARSDPSEQQPRRGRSVPSLENAHTLLPVRDAMLTTRTRVQGGSARVRLGNMSEDISCDQIVV